MPKINLIPASSDQSAFQSAVEKALENNSFPDCDPEIEYYYDGDASDTALA